MRLLRQAPIPNCCLLSIPTCFPLRQTGFRVGEKNTKVVNGKYVYSFLPTASRCQGDRRDTDIILLSFCARARALGVGVYLAVDPTLSSVYCAGGNRRCSFLFSHLACIPSLIFIPSVCCTVVAGRVSNARQCSFASFAEFTS